MLSVIFRDCRGTRDVIINKDCLCFVDVTTSQSLYGCLQFECTFNFGGSSYMMVLYLNNAKVKNTEDELARLVKNLLQKKLTSNDKKVILTDSDIVNNLNLIVSL